MGIKVTILLEDELTRRYERHLLDLAVSHGHRVVGRSDADLVVTDRSLASSAWLTVNVLAEGEQELPRVVERLESLLVQLAVAPQPSSGRMRRGRGGDSLDGRAVILKLGDGEVDRGRSTFVRRGVETRLTATELSLIERLHAARGSYVSRSTLEREVWGYAETAQSRTVLSTIHRLRQKVELDPASPMVILSDRQRGYRLFWDHGGSPLEGRELIGRDELVAEFIARLDAVTGPRLMLLTGESGIGKTHLCQHVATRIGRRRALWCECAGIRNTAELVVALARTLDCRADEPRHVLVLGHALAAREEAVLFLDDLDLSNPELGELVESISDLAKNARIAISSPTSGGKRGYVLEVPPLTADAARSMLASRRHYFFPDMATTETEIDEAVFHCQGVPLFLELAAREPKLAAMVSEDPTGATNWVDLAWQSLSPDARYLLGALAALPGGFFFDAVEVLAPSSEHAFAAFTELVRRALVVHLGPERFTRGLVDLEEARESRFVVLSHVRSLALEHGGAAALEAVRWLATRAETWAQRLSGDGAAFGEAMAGFLGDETNLSFATRWAAENEPSAAERLVLSLGAYLIMRGPLSEGLALVRLVRARSDSPRLRFLEARALTFMGQPGPAIELLRGLADNDELGERMVRARVYDALASLLPPGPECERQRAKASALFGETGLGEAERHETDAAFFWTEGRVAEALEMTERALTIFEREGCWRRTVALRINRGSHLRDLGRLDTARRVLDAVREDAELRGYAMAQRYAELNLAFLVVDEALARSLEPARSNDTLVLLAEARNSFGSLAIAARRHGKLLLAARAGVWRALLNQDPLGQRAELEVALSFALEVDDAEAGATASAALNRGGRTAAPGEPSFEVLVERLPAVTRRPILRLAGRIGGDKHEWATTCWRAACWLTRP